MVSFNATCAVGGTAFLAAGLHQLSKKNKGVGITLVALGTLGLFGAGSDLTSKLSFTTPTNLPLKLVEIQGQHIDVNDVCKSVFRDGLLGFGHAKMRGVAGGETFCNEISIPKLTEQELCINTLWAEKACCDTYVYKGTFKENKKIESAYVGRESADVHCKYFVPIETVRSLEEQMFKVGKRTLNPETDYWPVGSFNGDFLKIETEAHPVGSNVGQDGLRVTVFAEVHSNGKSEC